MKTVILLNENDEIVHRTIISDYEEFYEDKHLPKNVGEGTKISNMFITTRKFERIATGGEYLFFKETP